MLQHGFFRVGDLCKASGIADVYEVVAIILVPSTANTFKYESAILVNLATGYIDNCRTNGTILNGYDWIDEINGIKLRYLNNQLGKVSSVTWDNLEWTESGGFNYQINQKNKLANFIVNHAPFQSQPTLATNPVSAPLQTIYGVSSDEPKQWEREYLAEFKEDTCNCSSRDLANYGCKCGYFQRHKS